MLISRTLRLRLGLPRVATPIIVVFAFASFFYFFLSGSLKNAQGRPPPPRAPGPNPVLRNGDSQIELVVASTKKDNLTWLADHLVGWDKSIYTVDDPRGPLTVPKNKGREAMVFLTYIIDRYDSLPANVIFHHAERFQWHNDDPDYDALALLQRFRLDRLRSEGYVNLRCAWVLGCPHEIKPSADAAEPRPGEPVSAKRVYKKAFEELFPSEPVPDAIGVPCCSQFAVRRDVIRSRPLSDYVRFRDWLTESPLGDELSGRVLEYSWHIIFGKESVHCPDAGECYCKLYGLCDLVCKPDQCEGRYTLPPFSSLPKDWPRFGWDGEDRHWKGPA